MKIPIEDGDTSKNRIRKREIFGGTTALLAWVAFFTAGLVVDTRPYRAHFAPVEEREGRNIQETEENVSRDSFGNPSTLRADGPKAWAMVVVLTCFTLPNVAILSMFAGLLGCVGRRANLGTDKLSGRRSRDTRHPYLSGALRGFVVFLAVISGLLIVIEDPFGSPSQGSYMRLAGFTSIVSFTVNYDPKMFSFILLRARRAVKPDEGGG